ERLALRERRGGDPVAARRLRPLDLARPLAGRPVVALARAARRLSARDGLRAGLQRRALRDRHRARLALRGRGLRGRRADRRPARGAASGSSGAGAGGTLRAWTRWSSTPFAARSGSGTAASP